jgi:serine phosphatase RsbU (regulator of sigma subunit)
VVRYRASTAATEVGGDWYDALFLPDGRLMVTVGDVAGHDVAAAVTMGQIRLLLRSRAADSADPADLCTAVNRLLPIVGTPTLTTLVVAFVDLDTGQATFVNAGHPPPIRSAGGQAEILALPESLPLGVNPDARYTSVDTVLPAGSTLLLYTDGLIERRREPMRVSRDKLLRRVADLDVAALDVAALDAGIDALVDASATDAADDIAVLALRRPA